MAALTFYHNRDRQQQGPISVRVEKKRDNYSNPSTNNKHFRTLFSTMNSIQSDTICLVGLSVGRSGEKR